MNQLLIVDLHAALPQQIFKIYYIVTINSCLPQDFTMYDPDDQDDPDDPDYPNDPDDMELDNYNPIDEMDPINPARHAYEQERARKNWLLIIKRRRIRDFCDPFDVTFRTFVKSYRLSQDLVFSLVVRTVSAQALALEIKVSHF